MQHVLGEIRSETRYGVRAPSRRHAEREMDVRHIEISLGYSVPDVGSLDGTVYAW